MGGLLSSVMPQCATPLPVCFFAIEDAFDLQTLAVVAEEDAVISLAEREERRRENRQRI
jgi:hypothetical protein